MAFDAHLARLGLALQQALRGQHVLDLARADAEGERAERAVRGGVAVAADDGHARLGEPEFRADDVDDALVRAVQAVQRDAELAAVVFELLESACGSSSSAIGSERSCVGMLWSTVATVLSGRRTFRPRARSPVKACGDVTSWTRCRSM